MCPSIAMREMGHSIADGVEVRIHIHRNFEQQIVRIGMGCVYGPVVKIGHRGWCQRRVPHTEFIDVPSVVVASVPLHPM